MPGFFALVVLEVDTVAALEEMLGVLLQVAVIQESILVASSFDELVDCLDEGCFLSLILLLDGFFKDFNVSKVHIG